MIELGLHSGFKANLALLKLVEPGLQTGKTFFIMFVFGWCYKLDWCPAVFDGLLLWFTAFAFALCAPLLLVVLSWEVLKQNLKDLAISLEGEPRGLGQLFCG